MGLFNLFKKKDIPVKRFEKKKLNIGVTKVKITLLDGRDFVMKIYGHYSENPYYWVGKKLVNSLEVAKSYIKSNDEFSLRIDEDMYTDDIKDPKVTVRGRLIKKELLDSEDYFEEYTMEIKE